MVIYCYRCTECDVRFTDDTPGLEEEILCHECYSDVRRDYRAENANINRENLRAR